MRTLRPASTLESDAEIVGRLMLDAFPETFTRIFGERDHEAARAVGHGAAGVWVAAECLAGGKPTASARA